MTRDDVEHQARAFLHFTGRGGDAALWWSSKDFCPRARRDIEAEIKRLMAKAETAEVEQGVTA